MKDKLFNMLKTNIITIVGIIIGAVGGYFYWLKTGCSSGACPITSSPVMSTVWGGVMGGLILSLFKKNEINL